MNSFTFRRSAVLLCLVSFPLFFSCAGGSRIYGSGGKASDPVPFDKNVRTGTLPNGLTWFVLKNSKPENRAFLALAVKAGSIMEKDDEQGLAHFVEHMGFNGTARFPESELRDYLRSLGMRFGADLNAYTWFDETVYSLETPVETDADGTRRIPSRVLEILDDWSYAFTMDPAEIDAERAVIMEEYRMHLGAQDRVSKKLLPVLLHGSVFANRRPIGLPEIIENAPAETVVNFYRTWYRPDNMALIIAGDFDDAALEADLARVFSAPAALDPPPERPSTALPPPEKNRLHVEIITDPEYPYTVFNAWYKLDPEPRGTTVAAYRETIMRNLIGRMLARRFEDAEDSPDTPFSNAGAWETRYGETGRFYIMAAVSKPGLFRESLRAILTEKESVFRYGFTESEIALAKRALLSDLRRLVSERDRMESSSCINSLSAYWIRGEPMPDIEWEFATTEAMLPGISLRDIARMAQSFFRTNDLTLTVIAPETEAAAVPPEEEIRKIVRETPRSRIARPENRPENGDLTDSEPDPGEITGVTEDSGTGAFILTLENGATVILKKTENRRNEIVLYAMARGGSGAVPAGEVFSADIAPELIQASGLGPWKRADLVRLLAEKQVSLSFWTTQFHRGFEGSGTVEDMRTFFELLWLGFTAPRIDSDAFQVVADQYRTALARQEDSPEMYFRNEVQRIMYGNNPWARPMTFADIDGISAEAAKRFLDRCGNPGDYTFIFTGNIEMETFVPLVETWLASIPPAREKLNAYSDHGIVRPGASEHILYRGQENKSQVLLCWSMKETWSPETDAAAKVLSEYLDIALIEEIRERMGGVYAINAGVGASSLPQPGEALLQVFFSCDPERAEELAGAVIREIEKIAAGNIDGGSFTKSVDALCAGWEDAMQGNRYIARSYANYLVTLERDMASLHRLPQNYRAVTVRNMEEFTRRLTRGGPVRIIMYPENRR